MRFMFVQNISNIYVRVALFWSHFAFINVIFIFYCYFEVSSVCVRTIAQYLLFLPFSFAPVFLFFSSFFFSFPVKQVNERTHTPLYLSLFLIVRKYLYGIITINKPHKCFVCVMNLYEQASERKREIRSAIVTLLPFRLYN